MRKSCDKLLWDQWLNKLLVSITIENIQLHVYFISGKEQNYIFAWNHKAVLKYNESVISEVDFFWRTGTCSARTIFVDHSNAFLKSMLADEEYPAASFVMSLRIVKCEFSCCLWFSIWCPSNQGRPYSVQAWLWNKYNFHKHTISCSMNHVTK